MLIQFVYYYNFIFLKHIIWYYICNKIDNICQNRITNETNKREINQTFKLKRLQSGQLSMEIKHDTVQSTQPSMGRVSGVPVKNESGTLTSGPTSVNTSVPVEVAMGSGDVVKNEENNNQQLQSIPVVADNVVYNNDNSDITGNTSINLIAQKSAKLQLK